MHYKLCIKWNWNDKNEGYQTKNIHNRTGTFIIFNER